jgi:protein ImuB
MSAFACLVVPYFVAAAVERVEPALREQPLIVVTGTPPATRVVDVNAAARVLGVHAPMTEAEARARCPRLTSRTLADAVQAAARHALLDAALAVSPRVEDAGTGLVHVDASGLERLFGDANAVGQRLLREARAVGFTASVGLAETRAAARVAARLGRAITIVEPGREREMLAGASITLLDPDAQTAASLGRWGVRTLGELTGLPRDGVAARLGAAGLRLHDQALGLDREPFRAYTPPAFYQEAQGLDWDIETLDALATVLSPVLERLCARLAAGHLATDVLDVDLRLASGEHHHRRVALAYPLGDARAMLTLLRLDLEAHPPAAAVTGVAVTAQPVRALPGQHGLWQPTLPAIRELATVLSRLAALVGPGAIGSPLVVDSHRPDPVAFARFDPSPRDPGGGSAVGLTAAPVSALSARHTLALRKLRPPRSIDVECARDAAEAAAPASVRWNGTRYRVITCAGPWRLSGDWWDVDGWARDEWDVALDDGTLCRIALDLRARTWSLDAVYD